MPFREFKVAKSDRNGRQVIIVSDGTEIDFYYLNEEPFKVTPERLQFYGDDFGNLMAFETDYLPEAIESITAAIAWFAKNRLYNSRMELKIEDPRPLVN